MQYEENKKLAQEALAAAGYPGGEGFPTITYSTNDTGYVEYSSSMMLEASL